MFLFNVELLTLIIIDSLVLLAKPCPSFPIIWEVILTSGGGLCDCCDDEWGEGSFRCSLNLSTKVLEVSPIYSSSQERSPHWN